LPVHDLKLWYTDSLKNALAMLAPEEPVAQSPIERFDRFTVRMSMILFTLLKRIELVPSSVYKFLADAFIKGTLSIP
jgi:hypothetical protein